MARGDGPPAVPEKVFVGYVYGSTEGIDFQLYTHLFHAFLVPADETGRTKAGGREVPNRDLVERAHKAGVRVVLSLGGWGWDQQFAAICTKPEAETRFHDEVMAVIGGADYDGIDLDWEYPDTKEEVVGFERMTRRFRAALNELEKTKGRHLTLTMAAAANAGTLKWLQKDFLLETMDWVNVMTYDMAGDWSGYAGHNAPLLASSRAPGGRDRSPSTAGVMRHLVEDRGIPADRLAVGIPLYGRAFAVGEPYASTRGVAKGKLPQGNYRNVAKLIGEGWTRQWDDETKTPWLVAPDGKAVLGYDDAESVALKADWAREHHYRGVFFWEVGADRMPDGTHPLQEAALKHLHQADK